MTFEIWAALAVVCITVYGLLKRWETRLVLLTSGFAMCLLALDPIAAFKQFDKSMTNASLIVVVFGDGFRPSDEYHRVRPASGEDRKSVV